MPRRLARRLRIPALATLALAAGVLPVGIQPGAWGQTMGQSGLPLPRFVTLGTDEANLRTGPGRRYPVEWVFVRRGMPVEIVAEFDTWRRIRDWEGVEGWVHQSLLSGRRGLIVLGDDLASLWSEPRDDSTLVARVEPGAMGRVRRCPPVEETHHAWCWVEISGFSGWMRRDRLWGVYADEEVD